MTLPDPDTPSSLAFTPLHRTGDARIGNSARTPISVCEPLLQCVKRSSADERPVLILGTGEHVWEPFLLAEALERTGIDVKFSATTRSPILTRHDIRCAFRFRDHEQLGITNYLYNVNPQDFSSIVICLDTGIDNIDMSLVLALRAHLLFDNQFFQHKNVIGNSGTVTPATLSLSND